MSAEIAFSVAGRSFAILAPEGAGEYACEYLGAFRQPVATVDATLLLEWENEPPPPGADALRTEDGDTLGWVAARGSGGVVRVGMRQPGAVGRGIAILLARAFPPPAYLLVHGAGLRIGDQALVALGVSGAGKSTLSMLFEEAELLSDETLLLEIGPPVPRVHGTPIRSSAKRPCTPGSANLRALLALEKSRDVALAPLGEGAAVRLILEQALTDEPERIVDCLEAAVSLARSVERHTLHFRKDRDVVPLLEDLLR